MTETEAQILQVAIDGSEDPIELLLKMAEKGDIDPWNINIIDVTSRFLSALEERHALNLRVSGRHIFMASQLLRMKAEMLDEPEPEPDDFEEPDQFNEAGDPFTDDAAGFGLGQIDLLEREIQRRLKRKDVRHRTTNLYELIKQLRLAEKTERRRQRRQRYIDFEDELFEEPTAEEVVSIAHDEDYERMAAEIFEIIRGHPDARDPGISLVELRSILHWPMYMVYLPCLFLVQGGQVDLEQDELFGDLWVVLLSDAAGAAPKAALEEGV
ncbi:MAG TPA: ScpA family protein [Methanocorpusculum sp.]|nr:ScpA family protein [Methanocorpusculum sp.]